MDRLTTRWGRQRGVIANRRGSVRIGRPRFERRLVCEPSRCSHAVAKSRPNDVRFWEVADHFDEKSARNCLPRQLAGDHPDSGRTPLRMVRVSCWERGVVRLPSMHCVNAMLFYFPNGGRFPKLGRYGFEPCALQNSESGAQRR
jgi:hypothetical protein